MTGRITATIAGAAVSVAVLAVAVRPFLPDQRPAPPGGVAPAAATPAAAAVAIVAERTAARVLRCPLPAEVGRPPVGCGRLLISRRQGSCAAPGRCQVDLLGELTTAQLTVPVALAVTVARTRQGWRAVEVTS